MRMYSVSEAIGPAWERTQQVLRTGRWGGNLKMAFAVLLAEMGALFLLPVQMFMGLHGTAYPGLPAAASHVFAAFSVVMGLIFTAVYAALFFFGSRMQLTLVDLVLTRSHTIAPLWRRHQRSSWRWMGLKLLPSVLFLFGLVPFAAAFAHIQQAGMASPSIDPQVAAQVKVEAMKHAFAGLLAVSAWYVLLFAVAMLLYSHWRDFLMPYLGIDQLPVGDALSRWLLLWKTYPGQMLGYVFFRLLLLVAALLLFYIAVLIALAIPVLVAVLLGVLLKMVVHGMAGTVLVTVFAVLAGFAIVVWYFAVTLFGLAWYAVFFQCYSLYFLGGRDPRIGALLEPDVAVPVWTPPPSLPRDDDDASGPDFPVSPALA